MICTACRNKKHDKCPGGTWCDCQHRHLPQNEKINDDPSNTAITEASDNANVQSLEGTTNSKSA